MTTGRTSPDGGTLRPWLLVLVVIGAAGLEVELLLLKHYESAWQFTPLVLLGVVLAAAALVWRRPSPRTVRFFQATMLLCMAAGVVGLFLHYRGNVEFELERESSLQGLRLFWKAVRGATPALAPGAGTAKAGAEKRDGEAGGCVRVGSSSGMAVSFTAAPGTTCEEPGDAPACDEGWLSVPRSLSANF